MIFTLAAAADPSAAEDAEEQPEVAGDFNLVLLDELLKNKELEQVYCCNELNCGYAAEGYAGACGAAAAVVTFSVGGLSAINAIGGAYAENLPGGNDGRVQAHPFRAARRAPGCA